RPESRTRYRCRWPPAAQRCIVRQTRTRRSFVVKYATRARSTQAVLAFSARNMKFSPLVKRISGEGANAWVTHYEAAAARDRGEDVIILSVGDPDLETPPAVVAKAVEQIQAGDTHYCPAPGRQKVREAIAAFHAKRTGQSTRAENVVYLSGAQNALFSASMCIAGSGDEIISFDPMYPTYPATLEASGARLVRAPTTGRFRPD